MKIITGIDRGIDFDALSTEKLAALSDDARAAAKAVRTIVAKKIISDSECSRVAHPVSVFMAGAPGAGKTEVSKGVVKLFERGEVLRLDPDDFRPYFDCYNGSNSHVIQRAITPLVEKCIDLSMSAGINLLVDGTLSNWDIAHKNILRALKAHRTVVVMFVLQDPMVSWEFVKAREYSEGRQIRKEIFVAQYFGSIEVMCKVMEAFSPRVITWCTVKNALTEQSDNILLKKTTCLASLIQQQYTPESLLSLLK